MRYPTLTELPPPPPGKTGWPWTEESPPLPETMPDGSPWPRVSVVTPSYNHGQFIEETIRSVLLQGYPNLEYFVMDGGSSDGSVEIIRKYEPWLAGWVSEKDKGQSAAIASGLLKAHGDICGWVNSDDLLTSDALKVAMDSWCSAERPTLVTGWVEWRSINHLSREACRIAKPRFGFADLIRPWQLQNGGFQQPGSFFRRDVYMQAGGMNLYFHSAMDYDLYTRMLSIDDRAFHLERIQAVFRHHEGSKTSGHSRSQIYHIQELQQALQPFEESLSSADRKKLSEFFAGRSLYNMLYALAHQRLRDAGDNLRFAYKLGLSAVLIALWRLVCRGLGKLLSGERT